MNLLKKIAILAVAFLFANSLIVLANSSDAGDSLQRIENVPPLSSLGGIELDNEQLERIQFIWKHTGEWKEEVAKGDLAKWLIAISFVESQLGRAQVNLRNSNGYADCGLWHNNIRYYLHKHSIQDTPLMRNIYCSTLITRRELALSHTLETLFHFKQYWEKRGKQTTALHRAIMSYNVGYFKEGGSRQKIGLAYFQKVLKIYNEIEKKEQQLQSLLWQAGVKK